MILNDKNKTLRYSILGGTSKLVSKLETPRTVSSLWEKVYIFEEINSFGKYVLLLDFLYVAGLINLDMGLITLNTSSNKLLEFDSFDFINSETEFPELEIFINFPKFCEVFCDDFAD